MSHLPAIQGLFPTQVEESFERDELAFLSLTTKVEQPLRDKIAWLLNNEITDKLIIREWKLHDLVIMNGNQELETIIEFKNQLGFKMENDEYKQGICGDLYKSAVSIRDRDEGDLKESEILFVMFGRTLDDTPFITNQNVIKAMKYVGSPTRQGAYLDCKRLPTQPIVYEEQFAWFKHDWEYWLNRPNACVPPEKVRWLKPIEGGTFLGIGVKIITSIIGPFSAEEVFSLQRDEWEYTLKKNGSLDLPGKPYTQMPLEIRRERNLTTIDDSLYEINYRNYE